MSRRNKISPVGGPRCIQLCHSGGSTSDSTNSGWNDVVTFGDWFMTTFLPHACRPNEPNVLIDINLSSHFKDDDIKHAMRLKCSRMSSSKLNLFVSIIGR